MSIFTRAVRLMEAAAAIAAPSSSSSSDALGAYNVDPASVSVSGLSSGAFFSVQLGVAYSNVFQTGFAAFAGGPYDCARDQDYTQCGNNLQPNITLPSQHLRAWSGQEINTISALANRRVFLEVGTADEIVGPNVVDALERQLVSIMPSAHLRKATLDHAAHTFPTDFNAAGNNACGQSESPFISNCGYDGAGAVLEWMYGDLSARNDGRLSGQVKAFGQTGKLRAEGMAGTGYLYVPSQCEGGEKVCRLHVALHGCAQSADMVGMKFVENTGYNKWADTNSIIVLYPQAIPDARAVDIYYGQRLSNNLGCWDWLGWFGSDADQKEGVQMKAVVAQVQRIISACET